ncbi:UspA domain-containing protein [Thermodesulfatator indicus DSM 15286]|uniref:UspA domain-containing protein n=1 Tax=Thermodesulfatator indicus (strain DSM 15286 / JCM 11887 / CIR29812) TaxID=667014 RepID=F8ADN0_THEID|nr:universal stress protein [Thermodesulfatator indicus]AEH44914.1 UspA domain-containing protein [Thermodesulfatator indicus DSM 15286]
MGFKKMLVAVDGYEPSLGAFKKAVELAQDYQAEIVVLQVKEEVPLLPTEKMMEAVEPPISEDPLPLAKAYAQLMGVSVKTVKKTGPVAGAILATAREENVDLILLGDSGRKGFQKLYFGSVAQAVTENADRPVLVIKKGWVDISDLKELAKQIVEKPEIIEIPVYDPRILYENLKFSGTLFVILTAIYFFAVIITSKPLKDVAALEILGLPFGIWCGLFLVVSGIVLTRIYLAKQGGES